MKRPSLTPAWIALNEQLKRRFQNLTDAHLTELSLIEHGWLERLCALVGAPAMEILRVVEEVTAQDSPGLSRLVFNEEWRGRHLVNSAQQSLAASDRAIC